MWGNRVNRVREWSRGPQEEGLREERGREEDERRGRERGADELRSRGAEELRKRREGLKQDSAA